MLFFPPLFSLLNMSVSLFLSSRNGWCLHFPSTGRGGSWNSACYGNETFLWHRASPNGGEGDISHKSLDPFQSTHSSQLPRICHDSHIVQLSSDSLFSGQQSQSLKIMQSFYCCCSVITLYISAALTYSVKVFSSPSELLQHNPITSDASMHPNAQGWGKPLFFPPLSHPPPLILKWIEGWIVCLERGPSRGGGVRGTGLH